MSRKSDNEEADRNALRIYMELGYTVPPNHDVEFLRFADCFKNVIADDTKTPLVDNQNSNKNPKMEMDVNEQTRQTIRFVHFVEEFKNSVGKTPPIRVHNGTIEIPKSYFDETSIDYHKMVVERFPLMIYHELSHIEWYMTRGRVKKKMVMEWIEYVEKEKTKFLKSEDILIKCGAVVKRNKAFVAELSSFRKMLIKKFWWRLGFYGIAERWKIRKTRRELMIEKFVESFYKKQKPK